MDSTLHLKSELCFPEFPNPFLRLSVIVPAKNEAQFITSTLHALRKQFDDFGNPVSHQLYEVLVLANNCSDETFEICKRYQQEFPGFNLYVQCLELNKDVAHIGTARRLLMDAAFSRLNQVAGKKGVIVSTDADSEVDGCWIHHILTEMDQGVDVVGGRIIPSDTPNLSKIHHLRDVTYRFLKTRMEAEIDPCVKNPWPRHFQCYGPSLAVTCDIYERAGRIPAIPFLEDEEFRKALKRVDAIMRNSPKVRVYTSSRLQGRVDFGFSVQLQQWENMSLKREEQIVESLETVMTKFSFKKELRQLWESAKADRQVIRDINLMAFKLHFDSDALLALINEHQYFESLWELMEQHLTENFPDLLMLIPISEAIADFRNYFAAQTTVDCEGTELNDIAMAV